MNRVCTSACIFLLASFAACGDDAQPTSDAAVSDASPDTPTPDGSTSSATLGPQADAHRSRCEFFCDGKGDPSDACLATQREECVLACQSRLALVDTPCATCIVDETFIETAGDEDSCRYFILEENESGPCASFCGGTSELSDRADRVALPGHVRGERIRLSVYGRRLGLLHQCLPYTDRVPEHRMHLLSRRSLKASTRRAAGSPSPRLPATTACRSAHPRSGA